MSKYITPRVKKYLLVAGLTVYVLCGIAIVVYAASNTIEKNRNCEQAFIAQNSTEIKQYCSLEKLEYHIQYDETLKGIK